MFTIYISIFQLQNCWDIDSFSCFLSKLLLCLCIQHFHPLQIPLPQINVALGLLWHVNRHRHWDYQHCGGGKGLEFENNTERFTSKLCVVSQLILQLSVASQYTFSISQNSSNLFANLVPSEKVNTTNVLFWTSKYYACNVQFNVQYSRWRHKIKKVIFSKLKIDSQLHNKSDDLGFYSNENRSLLKCVSGVMIPSSNIKFSPL